MFGGPLETAEQEPPVGILHQFYLIPSETEAEISMETKKTKNKTKLNNNKKQQCIWPTERPD